MAGAHPGHTANLASISISETVTNLTACIDEVDQAQQSGDVSKIEGCADNLRRGVSSLADQAQQTSGT